MLQNGTPSAHIVQHSSGDTGTQSCNNGAASSGHSSGENQCHNSPEYNPLLDDDKWTVADGGDVSDNFTGKREGFDPNYGLGVNGDEDRCAPNQTFTSDQAWFLLTPKGSNKGFKLKR